MGYSYMGVRVSEREAGFLSTLNEARLRGKQMTVLPYRFRLRAEAVEAAVERFLSYRPGDPLVDERPLPMIVQTAIMPE